MGCEKAQLLLKQLLGMLPGNYCCAILPNKHTNTCLSKVFGLSNFEVKALLFYADAGVCHARWGFSASLTTWEKFHVHLEDEYSATDYYKTLFICKGSPLHKNPQEQIKTRSCCPLVRVLPAEMLSAIKKYADEYELQQSKHKSTIAEQTPPPKKQRSDAYVASFPKSTLSYNLLPKVFDLSLAAHDLKQVQEITNILVTELNTLHQALDSNMHLEIIVHNHPISNVTPMSGSKESSSTSEENEVRQMYLHYFSQTNMCLTLFSHLVTYKKQTAFPKRETRQSDDTACSICETIFSLAIMGDMQSFIQ
jgi:hypothetical protein